MEILGRIRGSWGCLVDIQDTQLHQTWRCFSLQAQGAWFREAQRKLNETFLKHRLFPWKWSQNHRKTLFSGSLQLSATCGYLETFANNCSKPRGGGDLRSLLDMPWDSESMAAWASKAAWCWRRTFITVWWLWDLAKWWAVRPQMSLLLGFAPKARSRAQMWGSFCFPHELDRSPTMILSSRWVHQALVPRLYRCHWPIGG